MASIKFTNAGYELMINSFSKVVTRTPVSKSVNPLSGEEVLTSGTPVTISGAFFKREDAYNQDFEGLFLTADAVMMVLSSVTVVRDDLLSYDGETFRVFQVQQRRLGTTQYYKVARCFVVK